MQKEDGYSNRELDRMFQEIKEQLNRIEAQTMRTNGKVRKLQVWQASVIGGLSVLAFLVPYLNSMMNDKLDHIEKAYAQTPNPKSN